MNIKDSEVTEKVHANLHLDPEKMEELRDLETLYLNHRLKAAADLELFDELAQHMEE
jgi:hypothetical protein